MTPTELNSHWLRKQPQRRTAIHEAGHAVVAIIEEWPFEDVVLEERDDRNAVLRNLECRPHHDAFLRIYAAGIMAARLARRRWDEVLFRSARDDLEAIAVFMESESVSEGQLKYNVTRTEKHLVQEWGVIESIASLLIRNRRVTHEAALHLRAEQRETQDARPFGKMGAAGWQRLYARLDLRIKCEFLPTLR
jgi:hypothetical protein